MKKKIKVLLIGFLMLASSVLFVSPVSADMDVVIEVDHILTMHATYDNNYSFTYEIKAVSAGDPMPSRTTIIVSDSTKKVLNLLDLFQVVFMIMK